MTATGFPAPDRAIGIDSHIATLRTQRLVLRNSKVLCWITMFGGVVGCAVALCFAIVFLVSIFPFSKANGDTITSLFWSAFAAVSFLALGPKLWGYGRAMQNYQVVLDERGADFQLGTKKKPSNLFLEWDQITAVKRRRVGNAQQIWVEGKNDCEARFSSYTFFRPKKIARLVAERAGLTVQNL